MTSKFPKNKFTLKPVLPQNFVGRNDQVKKILETGLIKQNLGLINLRGPQKIGRTSLLKFVQFLAKERGGNTPYQRYFIGERGYLVCLYIDMRVLVSIEEDFVHSTFVRALATSLLDEFPSVRWDIKENHTPGEIIINLEKLMLQDSNNKFFIFLDRAELLLDPKIQHPITDLLGILNDSVQRFGVVMSFGASKELKPYDVIQRTREINDCIDSISSLLGLFHEVLDIGYLEPYEAYNYIEDDWVTDDGASVNGPLSKDEIQFIIELSGGHPYFINLVGVILWEEKMKNASLTQQKRVLIETKALNMTKQLLDDAWKRLPTSGKTYARELAAISPNEVPIDEIDSDNLLLLVGEGFATRSQKSVSISSSLIKKYILDYEKESRGFDNKLSEYSKTSKSNVVLVVKNGKTHSVPLTKIETEIMDILLSKDKRDLVSNIDLYREVWKNEPPDDNNWEFKLTQRISKLRKKLQKILGQNEKIIENVYGKGYRLINPDGFNIMKSDSN